jgi:hypothetical protein
MSTTVTDIVNYMVSAESASTEFHALHEDFHSQDWLDEVIDVYPVVFRLPPRGGMKIKAAGVRGQGAVDQQKPIQMWRVNMEVAFMVGPGANKVQNLTRMAVAFIEPFYAMWLRDHTLGGLVSVIELGGEYRMGQFTFLDTKHYGVVIPVSIEYRRNDQVDR